MNYLISNYRFVYKATHSETGITYALKKIKMDNEKDGVIFHQCLPYLVSYNCIKRDQNSENSQSSKCDQAGKHLLFKT